MNIKNGKVYGADESVVIGILEEVYNKPAPVNLKELRELMVDYILKDDLGNVDRAAMMHVDLRHLRNQVVEKYLIDKEREKDLRDE